MKIKLTSVYVDDQEKALRFYTEVLGFVKKADFSQGPFRWLTVVSPEEPDGTELQLLKRISRQYFNKASPRPCSSPRTLMATTNASRPAARSSRCRPPM
jgi:catechol 2,3-dioxygenase-like lactoylglutathione lyase family enzyme